MNNVVGLVNSAWTVFFVPYTVNSCDVTVHMLRKKKKDLKTKDGSKPTLREHLVCSLLSIALACTTPERIPFYIYIYI